MSTISFSTICSRFVFRFLLRFLDICWATFFPTMSKRTFKVNFLWMERKIKLFSFSRIKKHILWYWYIHNSTLSHSFIHVHTYKSIRAAAQPWMNENVLWAHESKSVLIKILPPKVDFWRKRMGLLIHQNFSKF